MGIGSKFAGFVRDVFRREDRAREAASGGVNMGDFPVDMFGNLSVQTLSHGILQDYLTLNNALMARFIDYERMDEYPDCNTALNIYADDSTLLDSEKKHVMWTVCKDQGIKTMLDTMLHRKIHVDNEAWSSIRILGKYGNCLRADTRVWTDQGLVEIQHIEPGMRVVAQTEDSQYTLTRVVKKYDNGVKPTFRVRTRHRELFLTADHRVRTEQPDGSSAWVEVKNLQCGRYPSGGLKATNSKLILGTRMPEGRVPNWDELFGGNDPFVRSTGEKGTPNDVRLPSSPEPWFLRLFGFLLGNGWIASAATTSQVCFALGEVEEQNRRYERYFSKLGLVATRDRYGRYVYVSSVRLEAVLRAIGWLDGSGGKRVPSWVYSLPAEHRREFLLGFIDADGWITEPNTRLGEAYHFEISNYGLARDLKQIVDGLGLRSGNLRERTREPGFEIQGKVVKSVRPSYTLTFDLTEMDGPFTAERVVSIEPDGEYQVYDIEVEDESHSFVADGVVVHNCFEEILVDEQGVQGLNYLPAPTVRRIEGNRGALKGFVQSFRGTFAIKPIGNNVSSVEFENGVGKDPQSGVVMFEPWRIIHMRLRSERRRAMYGLGLLESARWVWKRLTLLEDAALISRLSRAPSRFAFYVDVGKLPTERAEKYLDQIRQKMKKRKFVNPRTGQLDLRYSPLATDEDFYLPVRESREVVRAEVLNTPQWTGVDDVEYFRNKLHAALMVPRAYLGYDENMPSRATLSQEDVRFARSVLRVQREYRAGITKAARVHLAVRGIDPSYVDFNLGMAVPSSIFELAQLEVQNMRAQLAVSMQEFVSKHWILSRLFNLTDAEIEMVFAQQTAEKRAQQKLDQEAMAAQMAIQSGGSSSKKFESRGSASLPTPASVQQPRMLVSGKSKRYPLEQELFHGGNRASEKRVEDKLNRVLQTNQGMAAQLANTQSLMTELKSSLNSQGIL